MAYGAGKDAALHVTDKDGVSTDITSYLTKITAPSIDAQVAEVSTLGTAYKSYIRTQVAPGAISVEGIYDPLIGTLLYNLGTATEKAFTYYPQGTASGKQSFAGNALLTKYETPADRDSAVTFTAEWQVSGAITVATI